MLPSPDGTPSLRSLATVVVGAGMAGLKTAQSLRRLGYDGELVVIGDEARAGYDRPPLSKQILTGQWLPDQITLDVADLDAEVRASARATALCLSSRTLTLSDGERMAFERLVIATGARARRLPLCDVNRVHVVRTLDDALALGADLDAGPQRVAIVGGGFIGAEVASSCRQRGLEATIIEPLAAPLVRVVGSAVGECLGQHYRDHGVDVRLGVTVTGWTTGADGGISALELSDGSFLPCDVAVVAVGALPNTEWLSGSGLTVDDGVVCDADLQAAPGVVAVGDVAKWPNARTGEFRRIEHYDNAGRQPEHAAATLLGEPRPAPGFAPVPWVWSDQFDRKIQIYGSTAGHDEVVVAAGSLSDRKFLALYRKGGRLCAALSVNMVKPLLTYRRLLEQGNVSWDEAVTRAGVFA
ncbi:NAD(P)/FAD-dependent oxidoreductase [Mycolicibacterium porcinum]|uniref:NAD(P)/FAD-dependent oxidoreductase n=1 Tax=Mycolicibacterium porcinum TaxID=39693 RepID=UPI002265F628|nr:FAD-dependent oxidoreductase [Mycolicibacterium porcinum]